MSPDSCSRSHLRFGPRFIEAHTVVLPSRGAVRQNPRVVGPPVAPVGTPEKWNEVMLKRLETPNWFDLILLSDTSRKTMKLDEAYIYIQVFSFISPGFSLVQGFCFLVSPWTTNKRVDFCCNLSHQWWILTTTPKGTYRANSGLWPKSLIFVLAYLLVWGTLARIL